jgi:ADP-ribose pyrophosphatase
VFFRSASGVDGIDAYLALIAERPELVADREAMPVVIDRSVLVDYVERTGTTLGVVMQSPFYLTLIDLLDLGGRLHPYSRLVPARRGNDVGVVAFGLVAEGGSPAILMIEQFRHATGRYHLELPRGFAQEGKSLGESAMAELEEETGYRATEYHRLATTHTDTGHMTQEMALFSLTGLSYVGANREDLEVIRSVRTVPVEKIFTLARAGVITDGYAVQASALFDRRVEPRH